MQVATAVSPPPAQAFKTASSASERVGWAPVRRWRADPFQIQSADACRTADAIAPHWCLFEGARRHLEEV